MTMDRRALLAGLIPLPLAGLLPSAILAAASKPRGTTRDRWLLDDRCCGWQRGDLRLRHGCLHAGPHRGDCAHYIGIPGLSMPGIHDGPDDTVDEYGRPNGWCEVCWCHKRLDDAEAEIARLKGSSMTYGKWLSKQSPDVQDSVLGKDRGKQFRAGTLTPYHGAPCTIEDIRFDEVRS